MEVLKETGLRALVHPLTQDDLADHTSLGEWIGEPVDLDLTELDVRGINQGVAVSARLISECALLVAKCHGPHSGHRRPLIW